MGKKSRQNSIVRSERIGPPKSLIRVVHHTLTIKKGKTQRAPVENLEAGNLRVSFQGRWPLGQEDSDARRCPQWGERGESKKKGFAAILSKEEKGG